MKNNIFTKFIAVGALALAANTAQATIIGVQEVKITSALPTWLQIAEVNAVDESGVDRATIANGALAFDNGDSGFHYRSSDLAIDGDSNGDYPNIFHSSGMDGTQFMSVLFNPVFDLDTFRIDGRTDFISNRDVYNVTFLGVGGVELYSLSNFAANQTISLPNIGGAVLASVPEPAGLALLGLGLLGLGLKRRKA